MGHDPTWAGDKTGFTVGHKVLEKAEEIFKRKDCCSLFSHFVGGLGDRGRSGTACKQMIREG